MVLSRFVVPEPGKKEDEPILPYATEYGNTLHYPCCGCPRAWSRGGRPADLVDWVVQRGYDSVAGESAPLVPARPLRVAYILPHHNVTGGMKCLVEHIRLLRERGHFLVAVHRSATARQAMPPWAGPGVRADADVVCGLHQRLADVWPVAELDVVVVGIFHQVAEMLAGVPAPVLYWEQGHEWVFGDPVRFQAAHNYLQQDQLFHMVMHLPVAVAAVSDAVARILGQEFGRSPLLIPNAVDCSRFYPGPREDLKPTAELQVGGPGLLASSSASTTAAAAAAPAAAAAGAAGAAAGAAGAAAATADGAAGGAAAAGAAAAAAAVMAAAAAAAGGGTAGGAAAGAAAAAAGGSPLLTLPSLLTAPLHGAGTGTSTAAADAAAGAAGSAIGATGAAAAMMGGQQTQQQQQQTKSVLLVGNPALPLKGFDVALAVLSAVSRAVPLRVTWVCQTLPGRELLLLLSAAGSMSLALHIDPPQSDLPRLYRGHDALLFTSRYEAWGMPVMEAMASGLPVVASRCLGVEAFAKHGSNALLADPKDVAGLSRHLLAVLTDDALSSGLGQEARDTALQYRPSAIADRLEAVLYSLASCSRELLALRRPCSGEMQLACVWAAHACSKVGAGS